MLAARFEQVFASRTRDEWASVFAGSDACVAPVLSLAEAPGDRHATDRAGFVEIAGVVQPAPAPRFSRSATRVPQPPRPAGSDARQVLADLGYREPEIEDLLAGPVGV